jgi:hypothetical protein
MKQDIMKYLKPDTPEVLKIKSLLDKEEEYSYLLAPIEYSIGKYFLANRTISDIELTKLLNNILDNYSNQDKLIHPLEKEILINLIYELKHKKTTHHELKLTLRYIIWAINNRTWMNDKQAYLKWITNSLGFFSEKESIEYEKKVTKYARSLGISQNDIDTMILRKDDDFQKSVSDDFVKKESEFFSLSDKDKFDYVLNNFLKEPRLLDTYLDYLYENENVLSEESIYKAILEKHEEFLPVEIMLGMFYAREKKYQLAELHLTNVIRNLDSPEYDSFPQKEVMKNEVQKELNKVRKANKK